MQLHHWWWLVALALGVAELVTGTFYLLVLALGAASGGLAAWWGAGMSVQVLVTALVAVAGWALLWRRSRAGRGSANLAQDGAMQLDVGERLRIDAWDDARRTQVQYRGARWDVELDPHLPDSAALPGTYVIGRIEGIRLIVRPANGSASPRLGG